MATADPAALRLEPPGLLERIVRTPSLFCVAVLAITVLGLAIDQRVDLAGQYALSAATWGFLLAFMVHLTPRERATTVVVIVVATIAEIIGSVIWGVYIYRLDNLPLFVPAGHGLVYLTGLRLSQTRWLMRRGRELVVAAIVFVSAWALLGLTVLERKDVGGAVGAAVLVLFLLRGRASAVYAGVFFVVAFLEIYGTWIGTWYWQPEIPGTGIANGNPPSGVASGYVFFDIAALALAPGLLAVSARIHRRLYSGRHAAGGGA
ncbi:MAG: hypothetical protein RIB67_11905 [Miltoncostaeaceae bacterium]